MNMNRSKFYALVAMQMCSMYASAQNFQDGRYPGLYFRVNKPNQTAFVISGTEMGFDKYSNMTYNIPETVRYQETDLTISGIDDKAFYSCSKVKNIVLPATIESIGNWAFYNTGLNPQIVIPNSVTTIGEYAFALCTDLYTIDLSQNNRLISIGRSAFSSSSLREIYIPATVSSIGTNALANCENLRTITVNSENQIYESPNNCNAIIHKSSKTLVFGCTGTENIPEGIVSIGDNAFYGAKVYEISIPATVSSIGDWAFYNTSLKRVDIPDAVYSIGEYAFALCSDLSQVKLSSSLLTIGRSAFSSTGLLEIVIPKNVISIGTNAFANCENLTKLQVEVGDNNGSTPTYTSRNSSGNECNAIMQGNVFVIGCKGTTTIPKEIKTISKNAFYGSGLNTIEFESPSSVETIEEWAFYNCDNLVSIVLPEKLKYIEEYAFSLCSSLSSVGLPESLKSIGKNAFNHCDNLVKIQSLIMTPFPIADNVFSETSYNNAQLYVPEGTVDVYNNTSGWKKFNHISTGITSPAIALQRIYSNNGVVYIECATDGNCNIYSMSGLLMRTLSLKRGTNIVSGISKGVYIINGNKVLVK